MSDKVSILGKATASIRGVVLRSLGFGDISKFFPLGDSGPRRNRPRAPYGQVPAVRACVAAKADALSKMPLRISTGDDQIVESGPIVQLVERPNPEQTRRAFWRATSAYIDLFGRAHWVRVVGAGNRPVEVLAVNPIQMTPMLIGGFVSGWWYRPVGQQFGRVIPLRIDDVHTITDPNWEEPFAYWNGLSPTQAVSLAIAQYYKADLANEASLDNDVQPGGALKTDKILPDDLRKDIKGQIQDQHSGVTNRRRMMLLEGGLSWEQMSAAFADMEFSTLKKMSRVDICVGFQVPPGVIGYFEGDNYAHADMEAETFWTNTILPRAEWLAEEWDLAITSRFQGDRSSSLAFSRSRSVGAVQHGLPHRRHAKDRATGLDQKFYSWFDSSRVPTVVRTLLALVQQVQILVTMGVPLSDAADMVGLPVQPHPWMKTWWRPIGLVDVMDDEGQPGATDPPGDPDDGGDKPGKPAAKPGDDDEGDATVPAKSRLADSGADTQKINEQTLSKLWDLWRASWAGIERAFRGKLENYLRGLRREVLRSLAESDLGSDSQKGVTGDSIRDAIGTVLFDLIKANGELIAKARPLVREAIRLGGEQVMREAADAQGTDAQPFNIADPRTVEALRQREIKLAETNRTLRRKLADSLAEGVIARETTDQLAERIRGEFNLASTRAHATARTEIGAAVEQARQIGRDQAGAPLKSWLGSRKETSRPWHMEMEAETLNAPIPNAQEFELPQTGGRCLFPRAATLGAKDVVNCGCTTLTRFPGDSIKAVLSRYMAKGFLTYDQLTAREAA